MSDLEDFRKKVNDWFDDYPARQGIVVFFDVNNMTVDDFANCKNGLHALEFATKYLKLIEDTVGYKDMLIEELE